MKKLEGGSQLVDNVPFLDFLRKKTGAAKPGQLAKILGVSPGKLSDLKHGRYGPSRTFLLKIPTKVPGVTLAELMEVVGQPPPISAEEGQKPTKLSGEPAAYQMPHMPPLTFKEAARIIGIKKETFVAWAIENVGAKTSDRILPEWIVRLYLTIGPAGVIKGFRAKQAKAADQQQRHSHRTLAGNTPGR